MVFPGADLSHAMNNSMTDQIGYAFALPRLLARLAGREARRAELSAAEAYGLGVLVFGMSCMFVARALLPMVRPFLLSLLVLFLVPFAVWIAFLLLYYLNSLVVALLRRLRFYSAITNNPFQHVVIMSLTTLIAFHFLGDECRWANSLGLFWLGLLGLNFLAILVEKLSDE
jgi:hypothetical protein